ncbi:MAG TPA: response regulator [Polyangiaceae bacterium]|nr:response regulator [Polyangiaceae bacterium]
MVNRPPRTVWVVDDSSLDAERARASLCRDYRVEIFGDGAAVLERISQNQRPDVLVLDWVMPGVSGVDVCRFLRSTSGGLGDEMKVLLLTAHNETSQIVEGLGAGADDYLAKPYAPEELSARVAVLIRSQELVQRVANAEQTIRNLLDGSADPLIAVDPSSRVTYANLAACAALARPSEQLIGLPVAQVITGLLTEANEQGHLPDVVIGDQMFAPSVRPLPFDDSSKTISLRNVTEHRRLEARRLDFYSMVAHDLRSPLTSILMRAELMLAGKRGVLPAEGISDLRKIENNVRSLVSLINDFLDLARFEGTGFKLERKEVDLMELVEEAVDQYRPLAEGRRLDLCVVRPAEPMITFGDRQRLMQVISNLMANAVKFTPPEGTVVARVELQSGMLAVSVEDDGPGIPAEAIPSLFQRYARIDRAVKKVEGTGLGLMIVREIVEAHGGTVGVDSEEGVGSRFWFRLPCWTARLCPPLRLETMETQSDQHPASILVVDDDEDIRQTLATLLEGEGHDVGTAVDGADALRSLGDPPLPDLILLDLGMPNVDGREFRRRQRQDPRLANIPVIIISAEKATGGDPSLAGAHFLRKPVDFALVRQSIQKVLEEQGPRSSVTHKAAASERMAVPHR